MLFLADLVISAIRLAEAEVRAFKQGVYRMLVALVILLAALASLLTALGMAVLGSYLLLLPAVGAVWSAFIVSVIALIGAAILALIGRQYAR